MSDVFSKSAYTIDTMHRIAKQISIQGVIGAGKSTFITRLKHSIKSSGHCAKTCTDYTLGEYYLIVDEPVDEWTTTKSSTRTFNEEEEPVDEQKSLLDIFYSDMSRWALMFQVYAFQSRLRRFRDEMRLINPLLPEDARITIISERSLRTDYLFFRNLAESGKVPRVEWLVYESFFNLICSEVIKKEDLMIYVDTEPLKCFQRIKKRMRSAEVDHCGNSDEDALFLEYLVSLDKCHKDMVNEFRQEKGKDSVYIVNGNTDVASDEEYDAIVAHFRSTVNSMA